LATRHQVKRERIGNGQRHKKLWGKARVEISLVNVRRFQAVTPVIPILDLERND